jgi:hypothetical protein
LQELRLRLQISRVRRLDVRRSQFPRLGRVEGSRITTETATQRDAGKIIDVDHKPAQISSNLKADKSLVPNDEAWGNLVRRGFMPQAVGIIHDADECHDETLVQLHGGAVVRVPCSLDEVLAWFA